MDFKHTKLSLDRSLESYSKIQMQYSEIIRNKKFQLNKLAITPKRYLNISCGPNITKEFINLDYHWRPTLDICWDITRGIPINENFMKGIFTEHCLEHVSFSSCQKVINDFYGILQPGGIVRIVVPDAEIYIDLYTKSKLGEVVEFSDSTVQEIETGFTPIMAVNQVFRNHGHLFAYDYETLSMMLSKEGFVSITKESFMKGRDNALLIDSDSRKTESLYVEALKPL